MSIATPTPAESETVTPPEEVKAGAVEASATEDAADALLMAGYQAAKGGEPAKVEPEVKETPEPTEAKAEPEPDPQEQFRKELDARFATLEKSAASANGLAGYVKQQLAKVAQGKTITKESLKRVSEEFGEEFAEAFAADLNAAGLGGGSAISDEKVNELVQSQLGEATEALERKFEFKLVTKTHKDAPDYFAGGKHNDAFKAWVSTLPEERQQEIATSWDSETVTSYLDEFKAQRDKAATQAARQKSRVERAVVPTSGAAAATTQPLEDPLEAGWKRVKGPQARGARG
jgi:hypothetical protein